MSIIEGSENFVKAISRCKCVVFDWDGTLVDSLAGIVKSVNHTAKKLGLPKLPTSQIRAGIGLSSDQQILRLYGEDVDVAKFKALFEKHYYKELPVSIHEQLLPGIEKMLFDLQKKGYTLAISTGKSRRGLREALELLNWQHLFSVTCSAEDYVSKPAPDMLLHISEVLNFSVSEMVMVGDSCVDLEMAVHACVPAVGVLTGVDSTETLSKFPYAYLLDSANRLSKILAKITN